MWFYCHDNQPSCPLSLPFEHAGQKYIILEYSVFKGRTTSEHLQFYLIYAPVKFYDLKLKAAPLASLLRPLPYSVFSYYMCVNTEQRWGRSTNTRHIDISIKDMSYTKVTPG